MPTFTAITLDRLLEPGIQKSFVKPLTTSSKLERESSSNDKKIRHGYASPQLYTTPKATPLPDSPTSFTPSPYIINHKRRGPRLLKSSFENASQFHPANGEDQAPENRVKADEIVNNLVEDVSATAVLSTSTSDLSGNGVCNKRLAESSLGDEVVDFYSPAKRSAVDSDKDYDCDDFFDPRDSMSVPSESEDGGVDRPLKHNVQFAEYFDADEELSSEGASYRRDAEAELREIRVNMSMEIERRKLAEEALANMLNQWQRIGQKLSLVGLTLPPAPTLSSSLENDGKELDVDPAEELTQQVVLARFVASAIGRGSARAEVELEMESQIAAKNFEINRLWDRLQYYETVNHEMSLRNQEAVELARRQRQIRKRRQRWIWTSVGVAITLGSAALAWSYLPSSSPRGVSHVSHDGNDTATHE